jgi:hypothetical protein
MASYSSEFETEVCHSLSTLIDKIAYYETYELDCGEEGFEIQILDQNFEQVYESDLGIRDDVQEEISRIEKVREERKREAEQHKQEQINRETRERELKELQRLSEKYKAV